MVAVTKIGVLLEKTALSFESEGVLNPAVIRDGDHLHLFYRAVAKGNRSSIGYCRLNGPIIVETRSQLPVLFPEYDYESQGAEDPRIVFIDGLYYITYTGYNGINALGALATSIDLKHFDKRGLIVPQITYDEFKSLAECNGAINEKYLRYNELWGIQNKEGKEILLWDKNVVFFPRKINNKFYVLHRIKPDIQIFAFNDLAELTNEFWEKYFSHIDKCIVLTPKYKHEVSYIGGGCPPIETEHGWLLIYHSVHDTIKGYVYSACAALLDISDPWKEVARLPYPLFTPEHSWELKGEVNNVCFPSGTAQFDDTLYIYYGAADERIACASVSVSELLQELLLNPVKDAK